MTEAHIADLIERALAEDIGSGDLTAQATVAAGSRARGRITQKQAGVISGLDVSRAVFAKLDPQVEWRPLRAEGEWLGNPPATVVEMAGDAHALLGAERVALNFLQHLSGIATATAAAVKALEGTGVQLLDTRKTTPGLRALEKRAVQAGGGRNHRMGLYDAILIKDNHAALAGGVGRATELAVEARPPDVSIEVECRTIAEVEQAIEAGADRLLLDNMSPDELRAAVAATGGRAELEASGGITLHSIREVAGTGVQFISLGSLTHSAPALDLSMELEPSN